MQSFTISDYYLDSFYNDSGEAFWTLTDINWCKIRTHLSPTTQDNLDGQIIQGYPLLREESHTFSPTNGRIWIYARKVIGKIVKDGNKLRLDVQGVIWKVYKLVATSTAIECLDQISAHLNLWEWDLIEIDSCLSMTGTDGNIIPFIISYFEVSRDEAFVNKSGLMWES